MRNGGVRRGHHAEVRTEGGLGGERGCTARTVVLLCYSVLQIEGREKRSVGPCLV